MGTIVSVMDAKELMTANIQALAGELRAELARTRLTKRGIAEATGIGEQTVYRYLYGKRDIPYSAMVAICGALGVSVAEVTQRAVDVVKVQRGE